METASTGRRVVAFLIDSMIATLFMIPVWVQLVFSYLNGGMKSGTLTLEPRWILLSALLIFFYRWLFVYFLGGTLGKLLLGLQVVPAHNTTESLGLFQSFLRALADGLSLFFGQSLRALAFLRFDRTHVSDWVAETRVVQFVPRKRPPRRRVWLTVFLVLFSFWNAFQGIYMTIHRVHFESGQLVLKWTDNENY